jgi:DNA uptake protein ComE-like DNA-binding protein
LDGMGTVTRRRVIAAAIAVSALLATPTLAATSSSGVAGTPAAAALPEVSMTCADGQTDINHASVDSLRVALGVDTPIAKRVVSYRPYLQVKDLLVVEGIGPARLAAILAAGKMCATPTSSPPPSAEACTDGRPDLQSASSAELVSRLGISKPAADAIVAARPFATKRHVTPERVPGVGKGTLDTIASETCLTPSPVRTASTSWRWAYRSQTTTVRRGQAALTVPAGVIDGTGAWASIADAPDPLPVDGPTADFHIWGDWMGGGDTVRVTLPLSSDQAGLPTDLFAPVLFHMVGDEPYVAHDGAVTVDGSTISTSTESLSLFISGPFGVPLLRDTDPLVSRGDLVVKAMRAVAGTRADQPDCNRTFAAWRAETSGNAIAYDFVLDRNPLLWCVGDGPGDSAAWSFANNTGAVVSFRAEGASRVIDYYPSGNLLVDLAFDLWNNTTGPADSTEMRQTDIPPGANAVLKAPAGTNDDVVGVGTNEAFALPTFLLREIGSVTPAGKAGEVYGILNDCAYSLGVGGFPFRLSSSQLITVFNCGKTVALSGRKTVVKSAISTGLLVADAAISSSDTLRVSTGGPWDVHLTFHRIAPPAGSGQSTDGTISGGSGGDSPVRLLKFDGTSASYVRDRAGVAHPVPDGGTYLCNVYYMPTQFSIPQNQLSTVAPGGLGAPATCPSGETRSLYGADPATGTLRSRATVSFLLRKSDGTAYLVNDKGQKALVFGYGSFDCFAESYLVWDQVTDEDLAQFQNEPSVAGRACVQG